jgi:hypothetical protein
LFKSTGSLDSHGHSRLRRKEIVDRYKEEMNKSFQYRKLRALYGSRPSQKIFPVDTEYDKRKSEYEELL